MTIPHDRDTTYWCIGHRLPVDIRLNQVYIFRVSIVLSLSATIIQATIINFGVFTQHGPIISSASKNNVHHIILYVCDAFDHAHANIGSHCDDASVSIRYCAKSTIMATWAVGGEVSCLLLFKPYITFLQFLCNLNYSTYYVSSFLPSKLQHLVSTYYKLQQKYCSHITA